MSLLSAFRRLLLLALLATGSAWASADPVKVVYHFSAGFEQASDGLRNIRNHLAADPTTRVVVVALGDGIGFMMAEAKDKSGQPYAPLIARLVEKGVEFRACGTTLTNRGLDPKTLVSEAKIVLSGVAEIARLQTQEGYAYLKP